MADKNQSINEYQLEVSCAYAVGDVHENLLSLVRFIEIYDLRDCALFLCGDNGLGIMSDLAMREIFTALEMVCELRNIYILLIRGNHDNPAYYKNNGPYSEFYRVKVLDDYTKVSLVNPDVPGWVVHVLCVGGAASVDADRRISDHRLDVNKFLKYHPDSGLSREEVEKKIPIDWWEDELPYFDEGKLSDLITTTNIDYVVSHTAPSFCPKFHNTMPDWVSDKDKGRAWEERLVMDKLHQWLMTCNLHLRLWFYGHFHEHNVTTQGNVTFYGLDQYRGGKFDVVEIPFD